VQKTFSPDSTYLDVVIEVYEGKQTLLGALTFAGQQPLSTTTILDEFDSKPGTPLQVHVLEQDIDRLIARYERLGFPFAQCQVAQMIRREGGDADSLDVTIDIVQGENVTLDEIRVDGNAETESSVIVRETRLTRGEVFNPHKVDAIRQRLRRLNIFADVSEPELYMRGRNGGLLIRVKEGNTNTFDGVIGYLPATAAGEGGYFTGLVSISMRNLFGTGRKLSVQWQREDKQSQELGLRYLEPWVFNIPANLTGGFFQRQQDTSYIRRVIDMKGEMMLSDELSIAVTLGSEIVIPSLDTTVNRVFKSSTITFGLELQLDTRDDIFSPTRGARYRTDYQYGKKSTSNVPAALVSRVSAKANTQKITLDMDFFQSTFAHQVAAVGFHGRELRSGLLEEGEMFRFGGAKSLRGYRENQFLGSRVAWSNLEYRFLLARRSFVYGFVDAGYYSRPADELRAIPKSEAFKYGYGIGIQFESGLGNLGVSFALGQGDTFTQGKIHAGLINEF
jgi:outer membrane protein insertion porin family